MVLGMRAMLTKIIKSTAKASITMLMEIPTWETLIETRLKATEFIVSAKGKYTKEKLKMGLKTATACNTTLMAMYIKDTSRIT